LTKFTLQQVSLKFDSKTDPSKDVDVMKCVQGCAAIYPRDSYYAGVRWDERGTRFLSTTSHILCREGSTYLRRILFGPLKYKVEELTVGIRFDVVSIDFCY